MSDFLSEAKKVLVAAARPLDVAQLGAMVAERGEVAFVGRRPGITLAARLKAAGAREGGCYEVGPGVWVAPRDESREGGGEPSADVAGKEADTVAWRATVLGLLDAMGYRDAESMGTDSWRAKIGWGSAETDVLVQLDGRGGDLVPEAVVAHRRALIESRCLAGVLVCRGRAGAAALAAARQAGVPLVTIVDRTVVARALEGRTKRRK